jgi:hypothetical protein
MGKLKGQRELTVDDTVLRLLALRQQQLMVALDSRPDTRRRTAFAWARWTRRPGAKASCPRR